MAYLREIKIRCEQRGCYKQAVIEVISWDNYSLGKFCRQHGKMKLAEKIELEKGHVGNVKITGTVSVHGLGRDAGDASDGN